MLNVTSDVSNANIIHTLRAKLQQTHGHQLGKQTKSSNNQSQICTLRCAAPRWGWGFFTRVSQNSAALVCIPYQTLVTDAASTPPCLKKAEIHLLADLGQGSAQHQPRWPDRESIHPAPARWVTKSFNNGQYYLWKVEVFIFFWQYR